MALVARKALTTRSVLNNKRNIYVIRDFFDLYKDLTDDVEIGEFNTKGTDLMIKNRLVEASEQFNLSLKKDPNQIRVILKLALCMSEVPDQASSAFKLINKAISLYGPTFNVDLVNAKGYIQLMDKLPEAATLTLKDVIRLFPTHPTARWNRGLTLNAQRQYSAATLDFEVAQYYLPEEAEIDYHFGKALYFIEKKDPFVWLKDPKIENHPLRADFYRGLRDFRDGNFQAALEHFQKAKFGIYNVQTFDLQSWQGECYLALGDTANAHKAFDLALAQNPKDPLSVHGKAEAFKKEGKTTEATEWFEKALSIDRIYWKSDYMRIKKPIRFI